MSISLTSVFSFLFLLISLSHQSGYLSIEIASFAFWIFIYMLFLFFILLLKPSYHNIEDKRYIWPILLYVLWNMISIIRGLFTAENYWEWKILVDTSLMLLIPLSIYIFTSKSLVQQILKFWFTFGLIAFFIFLPFVIHSYFYGRYLNPILLLLLLLPLISFRWKVITLFFTLFVLSAGFDSRSDLIRYTVAMSFGMFYYFRALLSHMIFKISHAILMTLPIILLILAVTNTFNIFKMNSYIEGDYSIMSKDSGKLKKSSLTSDTRTFIYVENIKSAINNDYVLIGRTPANGYDSVYFGNHLKFELGTGKMQRFSSEVSILNIFTWNGLVGVFLYFLVFLVATYLAIYRSNSFHMKIIGLFVAFRWSYAFVEDFTWFDIQYILLWILIAMCYSTEFRKMNDQEFKEWVTGLLPNFVYGKKY